MPHWLQLCCAVRHDILLFCHSELPIAFAIAAKNPPTMPGVGNNSKLSAQILGYQDYAFIGSFYNI
jgi:hypothetical protein